MEVPTAKTLGVDDRRADRCRRLASANCKLEKTIAAVREEMDRKVEKEGRKLVEGDLRQMSVAAVLRRLEGIPARPRSVLCPSNAWTFNPPRYGRIDGEEGHGYIPGDVYCNILWYWARDGDLVAEVMAGGGMIRHVYDDRAAWLPEGERLEIDLRMFDLSPRGPYREDIQAHDGRRPMPCTPDFIIMPEVRPAVAGAAEGSVSPFFGRVNGQARARCGRQTRWAYGPVFVPVLQRQDPCPRHGHRPHGQMSQVRSAVPRAGAGYPGRATAGGGYHPGRCGCARHPGPTTSARPV
jgi:hypothetical protein